MSSSVTRVVSVIGIAVMPVIVVAVISWWGWRCDKAGDRPYSSADRRPQRCTVTAGSGCSDRRPTARADETAAHKALHGIVRIGASR
jgi:hypothetical protein